MFAHFIHKSSAKVSPVRWYSSAQPAPTRASLYTRVVIPSTPEFIPALYTGLVIPGQPTLSFPIHQVVIPTAGRHLLFLPRSYLLLTYFRNADPHSSQPAARQLLPPLDTSNA